MKIKFNNEEIELVKGYLTNGEVNYIVKSVVEIYNQSSDIEGYSYSPLSMMANFYNLLFSVCIKDYNIDNDEDFNKYYNKGIQQALLSKVINAQEAYDLLIETTKNFNSFGYIIENIINAIINKLPDLDNLNNLADKLPDEWKNVFNQYNSIVGKTNEEDE